MQPVGIPLNHVKRVQIGSSLYRITHLKVFEGYRYAKAGRHINCPYCNYHIGKKKRVLRYRQCPKCKRLYKLRCRGRLVEVEVEELKKLKGGIS